MSNSPDDIIYSSKLRHAWALPFDWDKFSCPDIKEFVQAYSRSLGVPDEFLLVPLLPITASQMGSKAVIELSPQWTEPCIIWTAVAARKGEKKSLAGKYVISGVKAMQSKEQQLWKNSDGGQSSPGEKNNDQEPRKYTSVFSFERLHQMLLANDHQMLCFFDELSVLYEIIASSKGKGQLDRKLFLSLYNGSEWNRDYLTNTGLPSMDDTNLNVTGYIQPRYVIKNLMAEDADGFFDRQLFSCPPEIDPLVREMVNVPRQTPSMEEIHTMIANVHDTPSQIIYHFSKEAKEAAIEYIDSLTLRKKQIIDDENRRGVISKARGQFLRICMVLQCLRDVIVRATELKSQDIDPIEENQLLDTEYHRNTVNLQTVASASYMMNYFIEQKFALMPDEIKSHVAENNDGDEPREASDLPSTMKSPPKHNAVELWQIYNQQYPDFPLGAEHNIRSLLSYGLEELTSTKVMQSHLMPSFKTPGNEKNRYTASACRFFLNKVADLGLGTIEVKRKSLLFRKRKFDELESESRDVLMQCAITEHDYKKIRSQHT